MTRPVTVPSFIALSILFTDCQKRTYVKQLNVALPFQYDNVALVLVVYGHKEIGHRLVQALLERVKNA